MASPLLDAVRIPSAVYLHILRPPVLNVDVVVIMAPVVSGSINSEVDLPYGKAKGGVWFPGMGFNSCRGLKLSM